RTCLLFCSKTSLSMPKVKSMPTSYPTRVMQAPSGCASCGARQAGKISSYVDPKFGLDQDREAPGGTRRSARRLWGAFAAVGICDRGGQSEHLARRHHGTHIPSRREVRHALSPPREHWPHTRSESVRCARAGSRPSAGTTPAMNLHAPQGLTWLADAGLKCYRLGERSDERARVSLSITLTRQRRTQRTDRPQSAVPGGRDRRSTADWAA